ncbi:MAG: hypothetical protein M3P10_01660 [Actinomycetota bacterium]|nr:hypothetical protein [Actinomycetota bacterium]
MPALDFGMQQTHVMVRVEYRDVPGKGRVSLEVPSAEFEAGERGVQVGTVFIPWHRVHEYDLIMRQDAAAGDRLRDGVRLRARVVVDDGTPDGQTLDVSADRFESSPYAATMLLDRHVDADAGDLVTQKLSVPWHRIVSMERYSVEPDTESGVAPGDGVAPVRPDVG